MRSRKFVLFAVLSTFCVVLIATAASAETITTADPADNGLPDKQLRWGQCGFDTSPPPGTADADYNAATGELLLSVGEGIAVIGIGFDVIYSEQVDTTSMFGTPQQNDGTTLAYCNASGWPVGADSVGLVLPPGLRHPDRITFSYTPIGQPTVVVPYCIFPEPSTIAMAVLGLGILGVYWRRRGD